MAMNLSPNKDDASTDVVSTVDNVPALLEEPVDAAMDQFLRAEAALAQYNETLPEEKRLVPIPKDYVFKKRDRETVSIAHHAAFELMGGLPRFITWAQANPSAFYNNYLKLAQSETLTPTGNQTINFITAIPENKQDRQTIDATGRVIEAETTEDDLPS